MPHSIEQQYTIKFCVKLSKSVSEAMTMVKQCLKEWFSAGSRCSGEVHDNECPGCQSTAQLTENVQKVRDILNSDGWKRVRMLAKECSIPKTTGHRTLTEDLGMRKECDKMVPKVLSENQKAALM
ncbi:protein GVQW3-like [Hetaerina americana]|uniref:protein GVQW3-like n=1 Tax=Hetaerina americana TaxID=62018 RepID=UPI003A7F197D